MELLDFLTMDKERIFAGADAVTDAGAFDRSSDGPEAVPALPQMAVEGIHAGFPSPAQNYMEPCIDLNRELVRHPAATFYGRVVGDSMTDAGVEEFDIHGGGMDLMFPHHECELAQNTASRGTGGVKYWMHNNMITINGKKMGKSLGNFITLQELFTGTHRLLAQAYSPMTIRFFILQAHYRSTLDFSNEALQAAEKGLKRVMQAAKDLREMAAAAGVESSVQGTEGHKANELYYGEFITDTAPESAQTAFEASGTAANPTGTVSGDAAAEIAAIIESVYEALCDDLNTPVALSHIFDAVRLVNSAKEKKISIDKDGLGALLRLFDDIVFGVLGLRDEEAAGGKAEKVISGLMDMVIEERRAAKEARDWATSDRIRDTLKALGIQLKDTKDGTEWSF